VPECPPDAIQPEGELSEDQEYLLQLNAELAATWPVITSAKDPLPDAEEWIDRKGKLAELER